MFQFLIGRLRTAQRLIDGLDVFLFQFLIGRLRTNFFEEGKLQDSSFNSS